MNSANFRGIAISLAATVLLSGCGPNLVFYERSAFKLGVSVGEDPTTPLEVNAGLKRSVVSRVPSLKTSDSNSAEAEATSLVSDFDLAYDNDGNAASNLMGGKLTINTAFASGNAARALSTKQNKVLALVDVGSVIDDLEAQLAKLEGRESKDTLATAAAALMGDEFYRRYIKASSGATPDSARDALRGAFDSTCGTPETPDYGACAQRLSDALSAVLESHG